MSQKAIGAALMLIPVAAGFGVIVWQTFRVEGWRTAAVIWSIILFVTACVVTGSFLFVDE